jgi:hypothetical protein
MTSSENRKIGPLGVPFGTHTSPQPQEEGGWVPLHTCVLVVQGVLVGLELGQEVATNKVNLQTERQKVFAMGLYTCRGVQRTLELISMKQSMMEDMKCMEEACTRSRGL